LTLFLLILIFLYGSGEISSDYYLFRQNNTNTLTGLEVTARAAEILNEDAPAEEKFANPVDILAVPETLSSEESIAEILSNPNIVSEARYSFWGWFLFLLDITPLPKEITFKDVHSGEILLRSKDPRVLQQFRYR